MSDLSWLTRRPIAHRGLHDLNTTIWENTLSAFEAAAERGYAIECDAHLSRDGVPVIFHDDELKRLTGVAGRVVEKSAAELSELRIGASPDHVPTLAEALQRVAGRVPMVIELKGSEGEDEGLVSKVASVLASYRGHAAIMSFDHWLVREFPGQAPGVPAGLTAMGRSASDIEGHFAMLAHELAFVSYCLADLPNPFVTFIRERLDMPVVTWTVRDQPAADLTFRHADQMTFEGFEPAIAAA